MSENKFETAVTINAPIAKVYSYVADFPRHVEWNHQPQGMTALNGAGTARTEPAEVAVGSQFRTEEESPSNMDFVQKMMMMVMMPVVKRKHNFEGHTIAEIAALDSNERVAWSSHLPNRDGKKLMQMHWKLRLEEQNGRTTVTQACHADPPADSPFAAMVNIDNIKEESTLNLKRLKSILEA